MKIVFIVGSLEKGRDGVGDYVRSLACECAMQGHSCALLALHDKWLHSESATKTEVSGDAQIEILRLSPLLTWRERTQLAEKFLLEQRPDWVSLHFVCYAFHAKGIAREMAAAMRTLLANRRVHMMFHELWIGAHQEAPHKERIVGKLQKHYLLQVVRSIKPAVVHTSNSSYVFMLRQNGVLAEILPMFGSIPIASQNEERWIYEAAAKADISLSAENRKDWWIFGFFGSLYPSWPPEPLLSQIHQAAVRCKRRVLLASIGRLGNEKTWDNIAIEYSNRFSFLKFGEQSVEKVSQYLRFVDFGIAASPYGLIGKSSAVASMTEHGLPVVVNRDDGHLKGFDLSNSSVDPWLHKLDNTFQNKLVAGLSKREPAPMLLHTAGLFLDSLRLINK